MYDETLNKLNQRTDVAELTLKNPDLSGLDPDELELLQKYEPANCLIIYGSLAPGKSDHHEVEHINGKWFNATIYGLLANKGWAAASGFPAFSPGPSGHGEVIDAWVLISPDLPQYWPALDDFEGAEYRRILAEYQLSNGESGVGYIYASNL